MYTQLEHNAKQRYYDLITIYYYLQLTFELFRAPYLIPYILYWQN